MQLVRGANVPLADQGSVTVKIGATAPPYGIDYACYMVDATGKVTDPGGFVCLDQPCRPNEAVRFLSERGSAVFFIDFAKLPATIAKCVFTATVSTGTFRQVRGLCATACSSVGDIRYEHVDGGDERALLVTEVYRHATGWKYRAVGQGFTGDGRSLAAFFGAALPRKAAAPDTSRISTSPPPAVETGHPANTALPPTRFGKIVLDKPQASAALNLSKKGGGALAIRVRMTWHAGVDLGGIFQGAFVREVDVPGSAILEPVKSVQIEIALDKDAAVDRRSGDHEENLTISRIDAVQSILFAANIFTLGGLLGFGGDNFARYDGMVTVSTGDQDIVVPLASSEPGRWAVIARLDNAHQPSVTRIDRVVKNTPTLADFPGST